MEQKNNKAKLFFGRSVKLIALLLPIFIMAVLLPKPIVFNSDTDANRLHQFYNEPKNSLDVVLLGASDVFTGFSSAEAYQKYGFTSYPFAINSLPGSLYKNYLAQILKYQQPELILIEVNGFLYEDPTEIDETRVRVFVDSMPRCTDRWKTVSQFDYDEKASWVFPFVRLHRDLMDPSKLKSAISGLPEIKSPGLLKGFYTYTACDNPGNYIPTQDYYQTEKLNAEQEASLLEFLEFCKKENIPNIVFTRFPHRYGAEDRLSRLRRSNEIQKIVTQNGFPFLDLEHKVDEIGFDYDKDFYNDEHCNVHGQVKLTDYLSKWIITEYGLVPRAQDEANQKQWNRAVQCMEWMHDYAAQQIQSGEGMWVSEDNLQAELKKVAEDFGKA